RLIVMAHEPPVYYENQNRGNLHWSFAPKNRCYIRDRTHRRLNPDYRPGKCRVVYSSGKPPVRHPEPIPELNATQLREMKDCVTAALIYLAASERWQAHRDNPRLEEEAFKAWLWMMR